VGWPVDVLMNVNFPDGGARSVRGVEVTAQGKRDLQTAMLDRRLDARGVPYYWIGFKRGRSDPPEGTDLNAIHRKRISVTPLHLNLTEFRERDRLKAMLDAESAPV
jgi:5'-nucleotidase